MAVYELYGFVDGDLNLIKPVLEHIFGVEFKGHESDYMGGPYFQAGQRYQENMILRKNVDLDDGCPAEGNFPEYKIILYVNDSARPVEIQEIIRMHLKNCELLRHEFM